MEKKAMMDFVNFCGLTNDEVEKLTTGYFVGLVVGLNDLSKASDKLANETNEEVKESIYDDIKQLKKTLMEMVEVSGNIIFTQMFVKLDEKYGNVIKENEDGTIDREGTIMTIMESSSKILRKLVEKLDGVSMKNNEV